MASYQPFDFYGRSCEVMDLYKEIISPNGTATYKKEATIYRKPNGGKEPILINVQIVENPNSLQLFFSFIHDRVSL